MAVQFNVNNLLNTQTSPIESDPLTTVTLLPCCHKTHQAAAERDYGKIAGGSCELKEKSCVLCGSPVTSYVHDVTVRNLAKQIFGHEKDLENPPTHPLIRESPKIGEVNLPYPGTPAVFVLACDSWDHPYESEGELCRYMNFKSITENSLLKEFSLLGYAYGKVSISIKFDDRSFKKYLFAHCKVWDTSPNTYTADTHKELKTLFRIIANHNQIPAEQFDKIRGIVEKGRCEAYYYNKPIRLSRKPSGKVTSSPYAN